MADKAKLLKAFVRCAVLSAETLGGTATPRTVLQTMVLGKFTCEATNGRTVVGISEGGGSTSFALPDSLGAAEVMATAEESLEWLEQQPDPDKPALADMLKRLKRLRGSFYRAMP